MDIAIIIITLAALFYFKNLIKKAASLAEKTVEVVADTTDDSLSTYSNEVKILNAEKRSEQFARISKLDNVVSNQEIEDLLAGLQSEAEAPKA